MAIGQNRRLTAVRAVVIVPTYNEAENIEALIRSIRASAPDAGIIVVDDTSPDGTAEVVERLTDPTSDDRFDDLRLIRRTVKTGLGGAYRAGMRAAIDAGAEICIQIDADFSHDPAMIPALVSAVEHGADLALGSRYVPGGVTENWPRKRRELSRWSNRYATGVLGLAVNDATAGYRAYRSSALVDLMDFESVKAEGYGFQVEMTHRLVRAGGRIVEIPITFRDRTKGESKMSKSIIREGFVMVLALWVKDRSGRRERRHLGR
ncbi:MAG: ppm1 [Ilumatobacteraceae bacterium]|nr:ppm1 [Ilumatobacteraceae bacterium]